MKRVSVVFLAVFMMLSFVACSFEKGDSAPVSEPTEKEFEVSGYNLKITADSTFSDSTDGDFDLQITNDDSYISIMAFNYIDLSEGVTPEDVFVMQKDDLFSRRKNVKMIEAYATEKTEQGSITAELYSGERNGVKNYYAAYLIDFPESETFAWVLISAMPSYFENNKDYLHGIVKTLTAV